MTGDIDQELDDAAIDWLVLLHSGRATERDRAGFDQWRAQSPAHQTAACEAADIWNEIGQTDTGRAFAPENAGALRRPLTRRFVLSGAVAASAAGLVLLSGAAGPAAGLLADHRTRRRERRRIVLPDQSVAWLNTESALSVDFSGPQRRLTLHSGEALFEVHKDKTRPFIVSAGGGEARALGTVYAVRIHDGACMVDVEQGVVGVSAVAGSEVRKLYAGQRLSYTNGRLIGGPETVNPAAIGSWRRGRLIFNQRPLEEVVSDLQRYRYGRIVITDDKLAAMPVTGVFDLEDDAATFEMLRQSLPLDVMQLPLLTMLRPART